MKRHWTKEDFVVTSTSPAYDGGPVPNRFGYCRKCKADMQSFAGGPLLHYNSHGCARKVGALLKPRGRRVPKMIASTQMMEGVEKFLGMLHERQREQVACGGVQPSEVLPSALIAAELGVTLIRRGRLDAAHVELLYALDMIRWVVGRGGAKAAGP